MAVATHAAKTGFKDYGPQGIANLCWSIRRLGCAFMSTCEAREFIKVAACITLRQHESFAWQDKSSVIIALACGNGEPAVKEGQTPVGAMRTEAHSDRSPFRFRVLLAVRTGFRLDRLQSELTLVSARMSFCPDGVPPGWASVRMCFGPDGLRSGLVAISEGAGEAHHAGRDPRLLGTLPPDRAKRCPGGRAAWR